MTTRAEQKKIIGIVGGLGPLAHIDFEQKILACARERFVIEGDQDYPEWIVSSVPGTPDRTEAILGVGPDPTPWLLRSLQRLDDPRTDADGARLGAGFAAVPCNTAHYFLPAIRPQISIPVLDMIDETVTHLVREAPGASVGILATTGTLESRVYHDRLVEIGLQPVSLLDLEDGADLQERLAMTPIYGAKKDGLRDGHGIKAKGNLPEFQAKLEEAAEKLVERGAGAIIAGCTESPLSLTGPTVAGVPLVEPTRLLAEATIREAYALGPGA